MWSRGLRKSKKEKRPGTKSTVGKKPANWSLSETYHTQGSTQQEKPGKPVEGENREV